MELRQDYGNFPFDVRTKAIWFMLIDFENKTTEVFKNVSCKNDLVEKLKTIIDTKNNLNYKLIGFWQGQYSTDGFDININEGYNKLKEHF